MALGKGLALDHGLVAGDRLEARDGLLVIVGERQAEHVLTTQGLGASLGPELLGVADDVL
eukprot:194143-Alexandrium_andersonii.AAC.1